MLCLSRDLLLEMYPVGCVVELDFMDDVNSPRIGTMGRVCGVMDGGQILVRWCDGSGLPLVYGVDKFHIVE